MHQSFKNAYAVVIQSYTATDMLYNDARNSGRTREAIIASSLQLHLPEQRTKPRMPMQSR